MASSLNNFLSRMSAYKASAFVSLSQFSKADTYTSRYETSDESFTHAIFTNLKSFTSSAVSSSTNAVLMIFFAVFSIFFNLCESIVFILSIGEILVKKTDLTIYF
jgi:hypothetical protein